MSIKNYYIISKNTQKFVNYKSNAIRLSKTIPYSVEEVIIGKKGKPCKKITTFKDSTGKIIERIFNFQNEPLKNRIYTRQDNVIGNEEFVNSTTVKEYTLQRRFEDIYRKRLQEFKDLNIQTTLWENNLTQTNHVSTNINNGDKILSISTIETLDGAPKEFLHSFVEYPKITNGKKENSPTKELSFITDENYNVIENSIETSGVASPDNDTFLGFRALSIKDAKIPLTQKFLRDRKIDFLEYLIHPDYIPKDFSRKLCGLFKDGTIFFNKLFNVESKSQFVSTARHEVEHGWQYYLDARIGGQRGEFLENIGTKYGPITNKKLKKEALTYKKSIDTYVTADDNYARYRKNYIEIRANKAGESEQQAYIAQGKTIRKSFKHIPPELL